MLFRSTAEADLDRVLACTVTEPVGWATAGRYRTALARGHYRPGWTWIAEQGRQIMARAVWWGLPDGDHPLALDCLHADGGVADRIELAAGLLAAAHDSFRAHGLTALPGYRLDLSSDRRRDPGAARALSWRREAAARSGLTEALEQLRYEWAPGSAPPPPAGRLMFTAEPDDTVFRAAFRRTAEGSLETTIRATIARLGPDGQAAEALDTFRRMPGGRDWWRLGYTGAGQLAGLTIPSLTPGGPVVGYVGVVPELRGQRYVDDLLADLTRFHASSGAPRVMGLADVANQPMTAAFERGGYRNAGLLVVLSAPRTE